MEALSDKRHPYSTHPNGPFTIIRALIRQESDILPAHAATTSLQRGSRQQTANSGHAPVGNDQSQGVRTIGGLSLVKCAPVRDWIKAAELSDSGWDELEATESAALHIPLNRKVKLTVAVQDEESLNVSIAYDQSTRKRRDEVVTGT